MARQAGPTTTKITWRMPDELLERMHREHERTMPDHGMLSFNAWVVLQLERIFPPRRKR